MKIKSLFSLTFALFALSACDGDYESDAHESEHEHSFIGKRVRFIGGLKTPSNSPSGALMTTTELVDVIDDFLVNGAVVSNGTKTLTSSSSQASHEEIGRVIHINNVASTYRFSLASDGKHAILAYGTNDNSEIITNIIYTNDKTGSYWQAYDIIKNNISITIESSGTFEILD